MKHKLEELNELYEESKTHWRDLHAEMRSNILLISGDHYSKRLTKRTRDPAVSEKQKRLRITKNHIYKVHKRYVTGIRNYAGRASVSPQDDLETQDRKDAEMNHAVLKDQHRKTFYDRERRRFISDYVATGEIGVLVRWDWSKGDLKGYEQKIGEDDQPLFDEFGEPLPDEELPVFKGACVYDQLYGFNTWIDPSAKTFRQSPYVGYHELIAVKKLKNQYKDEPKKLKFIDDSATEKDFIEFNASTGYARTKSKCLVKSIYFRPSKEYPKGYFYMYTSAGILENGPLPFGIWPIAYETADDYTSDPRGHSPIKQGRPLQLEINRAATSSAMHQITIGDDKLIYQSGTKLEPGALLPGVRGITYQGMKPEILQGRDGRQYYEYIGATTKELYDLLDAEAIGMSRDDKGGYDPYSLLYKSALQKQQISMYSEKFEDFEADLSWITLELSRKYMEDDELIYAVGSREIVNIPEFRKTTPLRTQIKMEAQDETIETKFGRQLTMQHILQYSNGNLSREDIGLLVKNMPFANVKFQMRGMTINHDAIQNEILAIERGENPEIPPGINHMEAANALGNRMLEADFRYLSPEVQQMFSAKKQEHLQAKAAEDQALIQAKNQFIPVDGPLVKADVYINDPENPNKVERARLPQRALEWLIQQLERQGASLTQLENMNAQNMQELAGMFSAQPQLPPGPAAPQPPGAAMPMEGMMYGN